MATDVEQAFALGWQLAELYHSPVHEGPVDHGQPQERLPGVSKLNPPERSLLLARQIGAGLQGLNTPNEPNRSPPTAAALESLLGTHPRSREDVREAIWELHVQVLESLTVADFRLGKAYSLGRALGETDLVPAAADVADRRPTFTELFDSGRIAELGGWLSQLKTAFGPHAAYAVHGTLDRWVAWLRTPNIDLTAVDPRDALRAQGRVWRGLLSGEKQAADLLTASSFVKGALALLRRIGQISRRFVFSWWGVLILALISAVAGAMYGISEVNALSHTNKLAADIVTALAALGITTTGVVSSLGKIFANAEGPLWQSELDESCAVAATRLPDGVPVARRPFADVGKMF